MYGGYYRNFSNNMNFVLNGEYKLNFITQGLSARGILTYGSEHANQRNLARAIGTDNSRWPSFIYDPVTGNYENGTSATLGFNRLPEPNFAAGTGNGNTTRVLNAQAHLNYNRTFGDHQVTGLVLYSLNSKAYSSSNVDYNYIPENTLGTTGRLSYNYKQKYLADIVMAYNGSDRFIESQRFGFFPAFGIGWNISEENWVRQNIPVINSLKLRASYGIVGSDNTGGNYSFQQSFSTSSVAGVLGEIPASINLVNEGTLPYLNVTWESEKKRDLGLDFALFNHKLSGTLEYFSNNRYNILTQRSSYPAVAGVPGLPSVNLGKTENKGFEFELN